MKGASKDVFDKLNLCLDRAYAPYSNFKVAAAIIDDKGGTHLGVNVENQSFSLATCAESGAIAAMRVAGGSRIKRVYLLSRPNIAVVPCGACRQRLIELGDPSAEVTTFEADGNETTYKVCDLLPNSFSFKTV